MFERISVELTNRCSKGCWFCYNHSGPGGNTRWGVDEVVAFIRDCAAKGVRAASFGGGEPLQYEGVFDVLRETQGVLFRSLTTNGLPLLHRETFDRLVNAAPEKVHVSVHFPQLRKEVERVIEQVQQLDRAGVRSGVNLLVTRSQLADTSAAAASLRAAGIGNDRIVYLPMRGRDTPSPRDVAAVAVGRRFQSMTCLAGCARSTRFCSVGWDKTVAWCSYTPSRRPLAEVTYESLCAAMKDLPLSFCGGIDA
jgi:MoaA/NifB/PqqE/SkfB family radical SAM enzyme